MYSSASSPAILGAKWRSRLGLQPLPARRRKRWLHIIRARPGRRATSSTGQSGDCRPQAAGGRPAPALSSPSRPPGTGRWSRRSRARSHSAITVRSTPAWSRCIAVVWRMECGDTRLSLSEAQRALAVRTLTFQTRGHPGASHRLPLTVRKQRLLGLRCNVRQPGTDQLRRPAPQRHHPLLAAFAVETDGLAALVFHVRTRSVTISETRAPVLYITVNRARSR